MSDLDGRLTVDAVGLEQAALVGGKVIDQGEGLGRALLMEVARWLYSQGYQSMLVWVLAANRASGFYERLGARKVGQQTIEIGVSLLETAYGWQSLKELITNSA